MTLHTEIHIPASPTRAFANMLFFLVHSLADRAGLAGPWRVVVTLGRDGDLTPDSPEFGWARDFPVLFQQADPALWARFEAEARDRRTPGLIYSATILTQFTRPFEADLVIFMDADTVVARPFGDLLGQVLATGRFAAKPAWQPPPVDLGPILAAAGLGGRPEVMPYSGYGWSFTAPRFGPPYYNGGFIVAPRALADVLHRHLGADFHFVSRQYPGHYIWQIAQCLTLLRADMPCLDLDERYNMGIGPAAPSILPGAEGAALDALGQEQFADARVIHYCTPGAVFKRNATMADPGLLAAFLGAAGLPEGEQALQDAFAPYARRWLEALGGRR
jgi:hypothetical protein